MPRPKGRAGFARSEWRYAAYCVSLKLMVSINGVGTSPLQTSGGTTMEHYAEIDMSLECSILCVVDAMSKIVREVKVASDPEH